MPNQLISIGELIDQSWEIFRSRFVELMTISGWLLLTAILYAVALAFYPPASALQIDAALTTGETFGIYLFSATTLVVAPIVSFWIYISLSRLLGAQPEGHRTQPRQAMHDGRKLFLKALLTSVMVVLMVLFAIVIGFGPPAIVATLGSLLHLPSVVAVANVLLIAGIFVALYLSIQWTVYYLLAPLLTILEGLPGKKALEASRALIQGRFWAVLARVAVPKLVFVIFGVVAMWFIGYMAQVIIGASSGVSVDAYARIGTMVETVVPIVIAALINPLMIISDILLLNSLHEQNPNIQTSKIQK